MYFQARTYKKILPIATPDQSVTAAYWHYRLMHYHGVDRDTPYSPLAWCSHGYPLSVVDRVLSTVLTPDRIIELKYNPLDPQELLHALLVEVGIC